LLFSLESDFIIVSDGIRNGINTNPIDSASLLRKLSPQDIDRVALILEEWALKEREKRKKGLPAKFLPGHLDRQWVEWARLIHEQGKSELCQARTLFLSIFGQRFWHLDKGRRFKTPGFKWEHSDFSSGVLPIRFLSKQDRAARRDKSCFTQRDKAAGMDTRPSYSSIAPIATKRHRSIRDLGRYHLNAATKSAKPSAILFKRT
jgi:hypothetical protein